MTTTIILRTAARFIVPLSLLFALFVFFKGHQSPGGGFVAGLVTAVAMTIYRMAESPEAMHRIRLLRPRPLIAVGLLLALGTGLGAIVTGLPFLSSNFGHATLTEHYELEWATVMVFDLGVFLVVTGVVTGMIGALSDEIEGA